MLTTAHIQTMPVERFQSELQAVCGSFELQVPDGKKHVKGGVYAQQCAGLSVAHIAKDLHAIRRTKRNIAHDQHETLFLIVQEEGRALMTQNETTQLMVPGDMMLIDSVAPSEFSFFGDYGRQISVHLPRDDMMKRFGNSLQCGMFLPRASYTTMAISATLAKAFETAVNETQAYHLREAMFGLIGAHLFERNSGTKSGGQIGTDVSRSDLLQRGIAYFDSGFVNGDLTIQGAADDLGVSIRNLQRAFSLIGTTPTDFLLQRRLEHACALLLARRSQVKATTRMSTIAYSSGFNDVSYFNRQFRKKFGCPPSQYGA